MPAHRRAPQPSCDVFPQCYFVGKSGHGTSPLRYRATSVDGVGRNIRPSLDDDFGLILNERLVESFDRIVIRDFRRHDV